jgi:hypothetical protein
LGLGRRRRSLVLTGRADASKNKCVVLQRCGLCHRRSPLFSECGAAACDLRIGEVADQPAQCLWSDLSTGYANSSSSAFASFRSRVRDNEIRHVIERKGVFKPIFRQASRAEECPCIVDQNVDGRLPISDLSSQPLHFGQACEIGKIYGVCPDHLGRAQQVPRRRDLGAAPSKRPRCRPPI